MTNCKFDNCDLSKIIMNNETILKNVKLTNEQFMSLITKNKEENVIKFDLSNMDLSKCDLSGLNLSGSNLTNTKLIESKLVGTNLSNCNLTNSNLTNSNMTECNLTKSNLKNTIIENTIFTNAITIDCILPSFLSFDSNYCGNVCKLSNNNTRVTKSNIGWNSVLGTTSVTQFSIRLLTDLNSSLMIGMAPRNGFKKDGYNYNSCGWYFNCYDSTLFSQNGDNYKSYGNNEKVKIKKDEIITVKLNEGNLSFFINGKDLGIAYNNLQKNLYPAICTAGSGEFEITF